MSGCCKLPYIVVHIMVVISKNNYQVYEVLSGFAATSGGIRGTVVARWAAGKQVERSILRQGHDS